MLLNEQEKSDFAIYNMIAKRRENKELIGDIRLCDRCGIGSGETQYVSGVFVHANKCLHEYGKGGKTYELCQQCIDECVAGYEQFNTWYCRAGTWRYRQAYKDTIAGLLKEYVASRAGK